MAAPNEHQQLFGHEGVVQQVKQAYDADKLHHTLIFAGPQGIGKETLAYQLIRYALVYPTGHPKQNDLTIPNDSRVFKQVAAGSHPNVWTIAPYFDEKKQRHARDITLDALDGLQDFLRLAPTDDTPRFVLIDPADSLNRSSQNALLKLLEEPPEKTFFILLCSQTGVLLPTIRSRCIVVSFEPLSQSDFKQGLQALTSDLSADQAVSLYTLSHGNLGKALVLKDSGLLSAYANYCRVLLEWQDGDTQPAMMFAAEQSSESDDDVEAFYYLMLERLSDYLTVRIKQQIIDTILPEEEKLFSTWAAFQPSVLLAAYDRLQTLWKEGVTGYLDKKLVILRALGILAAMDSAKQPVLA